MPQAKTLAALAKAIDCRELRAAERMASGEWKLICKISGDATDFVHCSLCRTKRSQIKKVDYV